MALFLFSLRPLWSQCGTANSWRKLHLLLLLANAPSLQCRFVQCRADASQPAHFPNFIWKDQETPCWSRRLGAQSRKKRRSRLLHWWNLWHRPKCWLSNKKKNLKDKAYPSKTKTNCPNKTKPAFVTALTGRTGSGVEAVTQLLFHCRSACTDFAFPSCKAELKNALTRKLWYSRQIFSHALRARLHCGCEQT